MKTLDTGCGFKAMLEPFELFASSDRAHLVNQSFNSTIT
jgi:hypothetical protein